MYVYIYSPDMYIQKYTMTMKIIVNSVKISSPIGTIDQYLGSCRSAIIVKFG